MFFKTIGLVLLGVTGFASAATLTVTRVDDPASTGCTAQDCSLRGAVLLANALSGPDTIVLAAGTYQLTQAGSDDTGLLGDLDSSGVLEIDGAGADQTTIVSLVTTRILQTTADLTLRHLSILSGKANGAGIDGRGGGIYVGGKLALQDVTFDGNHAAEGGGAVFQAFDIPNGGNVVDILRVDASTFTTNTAGGDGGAIYQSGSVRPTTHPDVLYISGSTFSSNSAGGAGGALFSLPDTPNEKPLGARVTGTTIVNNVAQDQGGAILFAGTNPGVYYTRVDAVVENSFVTNNQGRTRGGAIAFASTRFGEAGIVTGQVSYSTFAGNRVTSIGAGDALGGAIADAEVIQNLTIQGNTANAYAGGVGAGGGISSGYPMTITDSVIKENTASSQGGGIAARSQLTLLRTQLLANATTSSTNDGRGGAIYLHLYANDPATRVIDSTISENGTNVGGGLYVKTESTPAATIQIEGSTFVANSASFTSAAIYTDSPLNVLNSTFDNNQSPSISARSIVLNQTTAAFTSSTLVGDENGTGNVIYQVGNTVTQLTLLNSIIRGTCAFGGGAPATNVGWTLESPGNTCGLTGSNNLPNTTEAALALGTLDFHVGPTPTRVPDTGSVAINAGTSGFGFCPKFDQRGYVRSVTAPCDLGAVEVGAIDDVIFRDSFDL